LYVSELTTANQVSEQDEPIEIRGERVLGVGKKGRKKEKKRKRKEEKKEVRTNEQTNERKKDPVWGQQNCRGPSSPEIPEISKLS